MPAPRAAGRIGDEQPARTEGAGAGSDRHVVEHEGLVGLGRGVGRRRVNGQKAGAIVTAQDRRARDFILVRQAGGRGLSKLRHPAMDPATRGAL